MGSTSPTIFSKSPELLRRLAFLLQSLGFCVARIEGSGSLPCHPSRLGLTTSWETEEEKFGFFSRKPFPQQSIRLYQRSALSYWAGGPGGLRTTFQEPKKKKKKKHPALLTPPGKTGPHWDGTLPSTHHPETGLAGTGAGREEGRAV